jgi:hypothetical protein
MVIVLVENAFVLKDIIVNIAIL